MLVELARSNYYGPNSSSMHGNHGLWRGCDFIGWRHDAVGLGCLPRPNYYVAGFYFYGAYGCLFGYGA